MSDTDTAVTKRNDKSAILQNERITSEGNFATSVSDTQSTGSNTRDTSMTVMKTVVVGAEQSTTPEVQSVRETTQIPHSTISSTIHQTPQNPISTVSSESPNPTCSNLTESSVQLVISVPCKPERMSVPSTTELILSARRAAKIKARAEADAVGLSEKENIQKELANTSIRLPHLREPTKEPEPTDPDFTVRLGAFMERTGEDSFLRLLQREFPEANTFPSLQGSTCTRLSSTPISPVSPLTSPSLSPVPSPREFRGNTSNHMGSGAGYRRASLTLRRRRESIQQPKGQDYLTPLPGSYITETESGIARFHRISRTVRIIVKVCKLLKSFVERTDTDSWSFVEMYLHVQQDMRQDLAFNPHQFTKTQPLNGGPRLQRLLSVPPKHRTAQHIQQITAILRGHNGFNDFPVHVQIQICRAMRYELYEARRILLRQGHQPTAFYMLLTGQLMVNIRDTHPSTGQVFIRTVSDLKEGDCFGELALLEQTARTATIICKDAVELLSISKEDFERIIRGPLLLQRENNIMFCQKHVLFEDFPCDVFYDNPEGFFFQYCPAGMTVVKNGQRCAYLVFVKTGKCRLVGSYNSSELTRKRFEAATREVQKAFPLYTEVLRLASSGQKFRRPGTHPEPSSIDDGMEVDLLTMVLSERHSKTAYQAKRDLGVRTQEYASPPTVPPLRKSRTLSNFFDKLQKDRRHRLVRSEDPGKQAQESFWACRLRGPALDRPRNIRLKTGRPCTTGVGQNVQRLEFLRPEKEGFAQIAELSAGDVYGLETLVRRQASRVSVVSEGAELLFISKTLFLQHANIRVLRTVNDMSITYPSAVDMHRELEEGRQWTRYKHDQVRHIVNRVGRVYQPPPCSS